jgi:high affinity sulfate transporter 1
MNGSRPSSAASAIARWIPAVGWLRGYEARWLQGDVVAGFTASTVVVPQAMAYAAIAGLPLVAGLYTALVPLTVYAIMGTSRPLSVTTTSTLAILTAGALREFAPNADSAALMSVAATLATLVGMALILSSLLRLGMIASFISEPVLVGFKAGIGVVIVVDQIPKLLGIHFTKGPFVNNIVAIGQNLPHVAVPTLFFALGMLALLLGLNRFAPRAPASLVTVMTGIIASGLFGLDRFGIERVGEVQGGLPRFAVADTTMFNTLWPAAVGIALMSFVETVAAGRAFRRIDEPRPEPNQELFALGLANLVGGLFHNMPSGGGTSQTAVNSQSGARSQIAGLTTGVMVVAVLFFLAPVVGLLPQATLAAVVVVPCAGMIKLPEFRAILRNRLMEFSWAVAAFAGVVILGTLRGILVAVLLSLAALIYHGTRRPVFVVGRKPGTDVFRPQCREHPEDELFPGLLLLKTEGSIHFANAQRVGDLMWPLIHQHKPQVLVIDCSAIPDVEYTALLMLTEAERKLKELGIVLWLAGLNPEPLELIRKSKLGSTLGRERMYFNLEQAVVGFQAQFAGTKPGGAL